MLLPLVEIPGSVLTLIVDRSVLLFGVDRDVAVVASVVEVDCDDGPGETDFCVVVDPLLVPATTTGLSFVDRAVILLLEESFAVVRVVDCVSVLVLLLVDDGVARSGTE